MLPSIDFHTIANCIVSIIIPTGILIGLAVVSLIEIYKQIKDKKQK